MEAKEAELLKCSICEGDIAHENGWTKGHSAEPINSGRCCSTCNFTVVIERRLSDAGIGVRNREVIKEALADSAIMESDGLSIAVTKRPE